MTASLDLMNHIQMMHEIFHQNIIHAIQWETVSVVFWQYPMWHMVMTSLTIKQFLLCISKYYITYGCASFDCDNRISAPGPPSANVHPFGFLYMAMSILYPKSPVFPPWKSAQNPMVFANFLRSKINGKTQSFSQKVQKPFFFFTF